jgi:sugar phosphate permease
MREALQASQPLAAACLGIGQVASAAGRLGWGAVSDFLFHRRRKPVLILMGSIGTVSLLGMAALPTGWGVPVGVALAVFIGLAVAGYVALAQTIVVENTRPEVAATAVGYNRLFASVGASVGPPLFGAAVDLSGYAAGWLLTAGIVLVATVLFGKWFREGRR